MHHSKSANAYAVAGRKNGAPRNIGGALSSGHGQREQPKRMTSRP